MKEINVYEIIKKHSNICFDDYEGVEDAIKDACQQVLELAAENAFASPVYDRDILTDSCVVDKQSILDVINQVK